ncbi:MAG: Zn-dependent hydrolase [Bacillota bacterium]|nr:Zn-dependent hydrolase [Bacillota bacterium]
METNIFRLEKNLYAVGNIGKNEHGGITRVAWSKEYYQAAEVLAQQMKAANLTVHMDELGNVIGRREGKNNDLPAIVLGSHLDTVVNGGIFDGNLGVAAALECLNTLNDNSYYTRHPLEIIALNCEELPELGGCFSSRVLLGRENTQTEEVLLELQKLGIDPRVLELRADTSKIKAFLELHIEQGKVLDDERIPVGIVNNIVGIMTYHITIIGEANHAGCTPMNKRKDAVMCAAKFLCKVEEIAKKYPHPFVWTVGELNVFPNASNVIPGRVELSLSIRDFSSKNMEEFICEVQKEANKETRCKISYNLHVYKPAVAMDERLVDIVESICKENGQKYKTMGSSAGHDAKEFGLHVPTVMIFVPSKNGVSHSPEEFSAMEDIKIGTDLLLETIIRIDEADI